MPASCSSQGMRNVAGSAAPETPADVPLHDRPSLPGATAQSLIGQWNQFTNVTLMASPA